MKTRAIRPKMYEILTGGEAQRKYGLYAENRPVIRLNVDNIPEHLHGLIPMAEKWGISDDIIRGDYISKSSKKERDELLRAFESYDDELTEWLAADNMSEYSDTEEYLAMTNMVMAAELVQALEELGEN